MNEEFNIVTIENDSAYVTIETLVRFSGNGEEPIKALIRKYADKLEAKQEHFSKTVLKGNLKLLPKNNGGTTNWSKVRLNERQAMFLLTLMANSEQVVNFKDDMETEFYKYRNSILVEKQLTPIQLMEKANNMLLAEAKKKDKEIAFKKKLLDGSATLIQNIADDVSDSEIDMEEYCQLLSSRATDTYLGRTKVYQLLRLMKLVKVGKTTPTQYGTESGYLKMRHHVNGIATKVVRDRMSKLTAKIIKYLLNNEDVNESLGYPFHPELRD